MAETLEVRDYTRKITPLERVLAWSPYAIVTLVARINGLVTEEMLLNAVAKVQQRHPHLRVRMRADESGELWFTTEKAGDSPVKVVSRESADQWMHVFDQECRIPFDFDTQPLIRFILVQSPTASDLIIFCHHVICDGLSLAYLTRDLMNHLGDPERVVEILPNPALIDLDNLPAGVSMNPIVKFFVNRMNKKWDKEKVFFDQQNYEDLNKAYWQHFNHKMMVVELDEEQTTAIVERCKKEQVTVNSALATAFSGAQDVVQGELPSRMSIMVAGNLRDRLRKPAGEVMGFYAGAVSPKYKYSPSMDFWENARKFHDTVTPMYTNKTFFANPLIWCHLVPGIVESFSFKMIGGYVSPDASSYDKLSAFSQRDDLVVSMLKREGMDSFDNRLIGTAVTNLGRMDFPRQFGALTLDRLIMNPGGAYPLALVTLVIGVVTCVGKMSLVMEYEQGTIDTGVIEQIRDRALVFLMG